MRMSDWSSDVCSADLTQSTSQHTQTSCWNLPGRIAGLRQPGSAAAGCQPAPPFLAFATLLCVGSFVGPAPLGPCQRKDRHSVVSGKSVSVRLDPGGPLIIPKTNTT